MTYNHRAPIVLHIPHASRLIPADIRRSILLSDSDLERELTLMTDAYTDELFVSREMNATKVLYPVSRLVLDPERYLDDNQEPMAIKGMGVVYTHTSDGRRLRHDIDPKERTALIDWYYRLHHVELEYCVSTCLKNHEKCLIVDCHSFPSKALPYELDQSDERPDICIGSDDFHTPYELLEIICREFMKRGYATKVNSPFAGSIVPMKYFDNEKAVKSVMIEVNRKLYMDEETGEKNAFFDSFKNDLDRITKKLATQIQ